MVTSCTSCIRPPGSPAADGWGQTVETNNIGATMSALGIRCPSYQDLLIHMYVLLYVYNSTAIIACVYSMYVCIVCIVCIYSMYSMYV